MQLGLEPLEFLGVTALSLILTLAIVAILLRRNQ